MMIKVIAPAASAVENPTTSKVKSDIKIKGPLLAPPR